jgi:hypothetical protein
VPNYCGNILDHWVNVGWGINTLDECLIDLGA